MYYGIVMKVSHDEATTEECPVKVYTFGWIEYDGRKWGTPRRYEDFETAVRAADKHRKEHPGNKEYHIVGLAIRGWV